MVKFFRVLMKNNDNHLFSCNAVMLPFTNLPLRRFLSSLMEETKQWLILNESLLLVSVSTKVSQLQTLLLY